MQSKIKFAILRNVKTSNNVSIGGRPKMLNYRILIAAGSIAVTSAFTLGATANATALQGNETIGSAVAGVLVRAGGADGANSSARQDSTALVRLLAERQRTLGNDNPLTLATMNALALLYNYEGRYAEAESLYKQALEASERTLGKEHALTASISRNLTTLQTAQDRRPKGGSHL
jgi:hypothetical protein